MKGNQIFLDKGHVPVVAVGLLRTLLYYYEFNSVECIIKVTCFLVDAIMLAGSEIRKRGSGSKCAH